MFSQITRKSVLPHGLNWNNQIKNKSFSLIFVIIIGACRTPISAFYANPKFDKNFGEFVRHRNDVTDMEKSFCRQHYSLNNLLFSNVMFNKHMEEVSLMLMNWIYFNVILNNQTMTISSSINPFVSLHADPTCET